MTLAMLTMERAWWAYLQRHRRAWQAAHREEYCTTPANLQQGVGITTCTTHACKVNIRMPIRTYAQSFKSLFPM